MSTLTPSQQLALSNLNSWFHGSNNKAVLQGQAGMGKTFLVDTFLTKLGNRVKPLLLAETNEAVNVLRKATKGKYECTTVCKALGLRLSFHAADKVLVQDNVPDLSMYTLILVDEASQLDESKLKYFDALDTFVLYIGHKSQLPPVNTKLSATDECISPVFQRGYPTFTLTDPVRNTGSIFSFCQEAERLIYQRGVLSKEFIVNSSFLADYLLSNKDAIFNSETVFLAYSNVRVTELNQIARKSIFGISSVDETFLLEDKVIFRSHTACFVTPLDKRRTISNCLQAKNEVLTTNTRGKVLKVNYKTVLNIDCYELYIVTTEGTKGYVYVSMDELALSTLSKKMYYAALYTTNIVESNKKWKEYHDMTMVFSDTKHSYAMTIHCSQGSTINNVFVDDDNIKSKCNNSILRRKLAYVGYSRAKHNLYRMI